MEDLGIGKLIKGDQHKDAIHVAVAPVTAAEDLKPGQHVGIVASGAGTSKRPIGIVDPFLKHSVMKGQKFWLLLYPGSITSLRHDWAHPAFYKETVVESESESWLRNFAETQAGISYQELMNGARDYLDNDEYLCEGGRWEGFGYDIEEFWGHYEKVTGVPLTKGKYGHFFSCSC